ncbi:MAG: hypothetical protein IJ020_03245 [Bacteroidaceae bacterium]|nr:hypothetical protein [Bacteroidaceae bacterium]
MGIKRITPKSSAKTFLNNELNRWVDSILRKLSFVGESALKQAREGHRYKDQTGNLTSSIGYAIVVNGRVYQQSSFEVVKDGRQGAREGKNLLRKLISQNQEGIVFIMVAGMSYAQYVEAMSLDVLDSAEVMAKKMLPKILKGLNVEAV